MTKEQLVAIVHQQQGGAVCLLLVAGATQLEHGWEQNRAVKVCDCTMKQGLKLMQDCTHHTCQPPQAQ